MADVAQIGGRKLDILTVQAMLVVYSLLAIFGVLLLWNNAAASDALKSRIEFKYSAAKVGSLRKLSMVASSWLRDTGDFDFRVMSSSKDISL